MSSPNIFSFIKTEEAIYQSEQVNLGDNWEWNMNDHIQLIFHLSNGVFYTGENDYMRAFKEVMSPMIELSNWMEDIELKDLVFFVEGQDDRVLSFLIKKYHDEVYAREHDVDTLIDRITEDDNTYGGVLIQDTTDIPEALPLMSIAFANQNDLDNSPLGFKYNFSTDGLRKMKKYGWGEESNGATISIDDLIKLADSARETPGQNNTKESHTTGKNIEVYIVRGAMPENWLLDNGNEDDWYGQLQIVAFYTTKDNKKNGVILYRQPEDEGTLRFFTSSPVDNRALGRGVGEKMIHPQIWTNFSTIHKMAMLEAGSKSVIYTDDEIFAQRQNIKDMDNLEIVSLTQGAQVGLLQTLNTGNLQLHSNAVNEWFEVAQLGASAQDPLLGKEQSSGTTFRGQERTVAQGRGSHDRKRGKRAKFIEELYRDFIIPRMVKGIVNGKKFLATLSTEELQYVATQLATNYANSKIKELLMKGELPTEEDKQMLKDTFMKNFTKKGTTQLIEILAKEFEGIELRMGINIANKQKDLVNLSDKLLSIFQFIFANPQGFQQAMQNPALAKSFQDILEFSGLAQADFMALMTPPQALPAQPEAVQPTNLNLNAPQSTTTG